MRIISAVCLAGMMALTMTACKGTGGSGKNVIISEKDHETVVNLFGAMEKSKPDASNIARTAFDKTIEMAEERLGITVDYRTYTAENYKEKTYDDVALDRVRHHMDDLYLLNPDTIQILGMEGALLDLSELENTKNIREVVRTANTVDGKLVAVPQEVVVYGLFVNTDMFDEYGLALPETPEDLLECCRVFKEHGIRTPIGAAFTN